MGKWYVIQVMSGQEKKVKKAIDESTFPQEIEGLIEEVLVPIENVSEVKKGQQKISEKRLWPGYAFVRMTFTPEVWQFIKGINGVIDFIGGGKPVPLSDQEVEEILDDLKKRSGSVVQKHQFEVGDQVKIVDGVFVNFPGNVLEVNHEKGRLSVMVAIFGRETRVDDLEFWQVEQLPHGAEIE